MIYDVAMVGAGPAGAACAAICAEGGLRTVMVERTEFPREKVCGDCVNPLAWPVLERLGVAERIRALPHAPLREVEIAGPHGPALRQPLPSGPRGEIGLRRRLLDEALLQHAIERGAEVRMPCAVERLERDEAARHWTLHLSSGESIRARWLVAADGRNSTVARLRGLLPPARRDRVARQARLPLAAGMEHRVRMRFLPWGYSGLADLGGGEMNLCLVARPENLPALQAWAEDTFHPAPSTPWLSITPLSRRALRPVHNSLLLIGDAARVVEPFTGEGIAYALTTGEAAACALLAENPPAYAAQHRRLYAGRLWVNYLLRAACLSPRVAGALLQAGRAWPALLAYLTRKIAHPSPLLG